MNDDNQSETRHSPEVRDHYDRHEDRKKKAKNKSALKEHLSTLGVLIAAPLMALFVVNFVFRTYQVDGPSMEKTLQNADRLIINKAPKTWAQITNKDYIPDRYDIIVFKHAGSFGGSDTGEKQLIKRVIGIPGDRVVVKNSLVTIYNDAHPNGYLVDQEGPEAKVIETTSGNVEETVGEGEVFVMGDNRENSLDSRGLGTVRSEDIVGKLSVRIYPFDKWQTY